jgi:glucosamine kinase
VLAGRASGLHPIIASAMRAALPPDTLLTQSVGHAHYAAARIAAKDVPPAVS